MFTTFESYDNTKLSRMLYADFLKTDYWKEVAKQVRKRDGHKCRVCNSPRSLDVHHRDYRFRGFDHLHMDELTTLCHVCHHRHHFPQDEKPRVVIQTVVKYVESRPVNHPLRQMKLQTKAERRFFRNAAQRLGMKAKQLMKSGRPETERLLELFYRRQPKKFVMSPSEIRQEATPIPKAKGPAQTPPQDGLPRLNGSVVVGDLNSVEADMPPGEQIVLTREILNKCRANGAFTTATVKALGLAPKGMAKGWAIRLEGTTVTRETLLNAMRGRCLYSPATLRERRKRERQALT